MQRIALGNSAFETVIEGNVKSYIVNSETFIVYVDPREHLVRFGFVYMKSPQTERLDTKQVSVLKINGRMISVRNSSPVC